MRPIDKDKLITSIAWHDQQGMISTIDDVLDIIEAFPTLTPQNEPLTCAGCFYLDEQCVPCAHCIRAAGYADYYRLAAIEDILGDEYELDRLRELSQADREGRCVVLDDLTVADLQQMLTVLDCTRYGDGAETYTTGYRNGHRNGRIEILRHVLGINEGDSAESQDALRREQDE